MRRRDEDGTKRFMSQTDLLSRAMSLTGRVALDMECWMIWRLQSEVKEMNRTNQTATVHVCINDCLYLCPVPSAELVTETDVEMLAQQAQVVAGQGCT